MTFEKKLEEQIRKVISTWREDGIYAISFLLTNNEESVYKGISNFPEFSVGYNTENDCEDDDLLSEERWNFACWSQNNVVLVDAEPEHSELANELIQWYEKNGVKDVGFEDEDKMYDEECRYIGKGPNGYWELMSLVSDIARKLQTEGVVRKQFGNIPIIVHDLEYSWFVSKMTENANPNGEAKVFLEYLLSSSEEIED